MRVNDSVAPVAVVKQCTVVEDYSSRYSVASNTSAGQCDLVVLNATEDDAGQYNCIDNATATSLAYLTVIGTLTTLSSFCDRRCYNLITRQLKP